MIQQPQTSTAEDEFVKQLNTYLAYPLSKHGENKVRTLLLEYKAKSAEYRFRRLPDPLSTTSGVTKNFIAADDILDIVGDYLKTPPIKFLVKKRDAQLVYARAMSIYFIRKYTLLSLKQIGKLIGGKDHTTIIHSLARFKDLALTCEHVQTDVTNVNVRVLELKLNTLK